MSTKEPPEARANRPSSSSSSGKRKHYPWGLCFGRFFKRLFLGVFIWVVMFILLLLSAIPYGGGHQGLDSLLRISMLLLPLWALAGFVAPDDNQEKTNDVSFVPPSETSAAPSNGAIKMAGYVLLALLTVGLAVAGLTKQGRKEEKERKAQTRRFDSALHACRADLDKISAPVQVRSLLIESGLLDDAMLSALLGERGLKFIELRERSTQAANDPNERDGSVSLPPGSPDAKIVRLSLSTMGDPACTTQRLLDFNLDLDTGRAPFAPNTCLAKEVDNASHATHALKAIPSDSDAALIKWAIVEQANGVVFASLTSSDTPSRPLSPRIDSRSDVKIIDGNPLSCDSPHFSLMNLMYAPARSKNERLSLGKREVMLDMELAHPDKLGVSELIEVPEEAIGDRQARKHRPAWPDWHKAYRTAEQQGWAPFGEGIIEFKEGLIITPRLRNGSGRNTRVQGSDRGFMVAWDVKENRTMLAQFGLDGRLLWTRQLVTAMAADPHGSGFSLDAMEWDRREVRLYGSRKNGNYQVEARRLIVPVPAQARPRKSTPG